MPLADAINRPLSSFNWCENMPQSLDENIRAAASGDPDAWRWLILRYESWE